jgi:alkylated DNA repair protein (DNA oxidative demethylase)
MSSPPPAARPIRGDEVIREPGFSYLPRFVSAAEAEELGRYFAGLRPLWEQRYGPDSESRRGNGGRLTRPVYWLGAWQFAGLGYYSEPDHQHQKCVSAEPIPPVMVSILERLRDELALHGDHGPLPNTCLINYYGSEPKDGRKPPVDYARLRMHRDAEPGAVVMLSVGQPAQFEFVTPGAESPEHAQWVRNRSVILISGDDYKDRLYHRVTRVRYGAEPVLGSKLDGFDVRRVSVSFRHVPPEHIHDLGELDEPARRVVWPYVEELAEYSEYFDAQLQAAREDSGVS